MFLIGSDSVYVLVTLHPLVYLKSLPQWWSKSSYHIGLSSQIRNRPTRPNRPIRPENWPTQRQWRVGGRSLLPEPENGGSVGRFEAKKPIFNRPDRIWPENRTFSVWFVEIRPELEKPCEISSRFGLISSRYVKISLRFDLISSRYVEISSRSSQISPRLA